MMFRLFPATVLSFTILCASSITACSTETLENEHIFGNPRSGTDIAGYGWLAITSFLPMPEGQALRVRLNGRDLIWGPEDPDFIEILEAGGSVGALVPAGDYTIELFDRSGRTWTSTGPVKVLPPNAEFSFPERMTAVHFYGDAAQPSLFVSEPLMQDDDPETHELTVRNGRPDRAIVLERCVIADQAGGFDCETVATLPAGDTWSGKLLQSHVVYPFVGEALVMARPADPGDTSAATQILSLNDPPESYGNGCQVSGALITDYAHETTYPLLLSTWGCGSL